MGAGLATSTACAEGDVVRLLDAAVWYVATFTHKAHVSGRDIDGFEAVRTRDDHTKGFFVAFDYTEDTLTEIDAFLRESGKAIVALMVKEILDEQIAKKLV